ncbi:MAG TPA: glycine cleavage system aminomethyltransferase GcvT [Candidatus Aminicenantes bacterium]|nr:glycine cleavage system aminomethyltransferase GcvT [Candidatus Aminicenantes bacterium]
MKKTRINEAHYILKGKMVEFCGWDLPVQYSGLNLEHMAVRTTGGIFDVSHMGEIWFRGREALRAVNHIVSNDAAKLVPGRIQYAGLLTDHGCFVDDLLVYMIKENEYLLVVNAANIEKDFQWMKKHTARFDVQVENRSEEYSQIAVQGPVAEKLVQEFTDIDLKPMGYYHFAQGRVQGADAIVSRTGYTGEDGFEIYFRADAAAASKLFLDLADRGEKYDALPAGLGARDTLRLEAKMALYGNDIDDAHTVLEADLGWILKLKKAEPFIGQEALARQKEAGIARKLVGFELVDKGIARHGYPITVEGKPFGAVTSGTFAPFLKKPIGMAYLPADHSAVGSEFQVAIRDKTVTARVVETPFYKRSK